jgi:hypothetical protein
MEKIKRVAICGLLVFAVFLWLLLSAGETNAQIHCSDMTLKGSFGMTCTGERIDGGDPGPRAVVGRVTMDGHGGLSGSVTKSKNGTIIRDLTVTGTYAVNSDCTGSLTDIHSDGETRTLDFVIVEIGLEIFAIQVDIGRVITCDLKR